MPSPARRSTAPHYLVQLERPQIFPQRPAQILAFQRKFDRCLNKTKLVASVVAFTLVNVGVHFFLLEQQAQRVRKLNFSTFAGWRSRKTTEDRPSQNVSADDRQI